MRLLPRSRLGRGVLAAVAAVVLWQGGHFGLRYWQFDTLFRADRIVENFRSMPQYFNSIAMHNSGEVLPWAVAEKPLPEKFLFQGKDYRLQDWIASTGTTGLMVVADGKVAFEQYYQGNTAQTEAISWSLGKSFVSSLIGFAVADGSIKSLRDPVSDYVPLLKGGGYEGVPIQDVLEMSSGIDFDEDYANPDAGINVLGQRIFLGQTTNDWVAQRKRAKAPGTEHHYISIDTQVLGMVLEAATGKSVAQYMQEKLWSRMGAEGDARWVTDAHGAVLAFAGLNARLRDYARFGQLYLDGGRNLRGEQVLPEQWVRTSVKPRTAYLQPGRTVEEGNPRLGYAYQWWVPQGDEGEFTAIGVYGQFIYVNPTRRIVIAKNSAYVDYNKDGTQMEYQSIEAFRAIARAMRP
ncbi:serine hydrolase [Curvibacter sp. APW13]|uniref:serine hydrolase domain-containing protein n=1 Tax=Curvibacter sp. APW13 TaxID=3077236 RepID=UPI0028DD4DE9|nr:serine hydrolase [Curvibacter sp. APW13]MDT8991598.1 serine hydrolase [Curvibacter sp. APW13]